MKSVQWLGLSLTIALLLLCACGQPSAGGPDPLTMTGIQSLPNMGQQITPLAPPGARFEPMNPDLADQPDWLAGQAVTTVVSPDHKTLLVLTSGYNRVFNTDDAPDAYGTLFNWPDSNEYVFIYDISTPTPVKQASRADPQYLQRDRLRSIRHGFLRGRRRR